MKNSSYSLAFGKEHLDFLMPGIADVDWISPPIFPAAIDPVREVESALNHPLGGFNWESVKPGPNIALVINDKTRPVPLKHMIPPLLDKIENIHPKKITFYVATGTHTPLSTEEMEILLPAHLRRGAEIISHDCDNPNELSYIGQTSRGTQVWINKNFLQADLKISLGNIEPHHFAGFSGGAKSVAIGLAGRETINQNHRWLLDPNSFIGIYENNPLRQDIEEIGQLTGLDLVLNTILNADLDLVHAISGTPAEVMAAGIPLSKGICQVPVRGKYDMVIASVGGFPKDINLYQSQKALTHASLFLRDGGVCILVAECIEGMGSAGFVDFMKYCRRWEDVSPRIEQLGFKVGPHKALQFAREALRTKILLVSSMPEELVRSVLLEPAASIESAISNGVQVLQNSSIRCAILPHATNTIPSFEGV
jgi:lactate racemase